ncbi:MAG: phosphatidate cytidylyltransferase [Clostridia bacterium]|nr:phosphatidate cytidylyltransferase [Clostridia bacterium]
MKTRIIVGVALVAVFCTALAFGGFVTFAIFTAGVVLCVYEMGRLFRTKGYNPFMWGAYLCAALMYTAYVLYGGAALAVWCALCAILSVSERLWNKNRSMEDIFCSLLVCMYPLLFCAILACVMAYPDRVVGRTAMLLCFASPLLGDTLAYFIGSALGRHKLCPDISPKKTVEGSLAGLAGAVLGGLATWAVSPLWGHEAHLPLLLVLGFVCGVLGEVGDLFASLFKRWANVKDYGSIFPGHGGMMDRIDSVLFCAPIGLLYIIWMNAIK